MTFGSCVWLHVIGDHHLLARFGSRELPRYLQKAVTKRKGSVLSTYDDNTASGARRTDTDGLFGRQIQTWVEFEDRIVQLEGEQALTREGAIALLRAFAVAEEAATAVVRGRVEDALARSRARTMRQTGELGPNDPVPAWVPPNDRAPLTDDQRSDDEQLVDDAMVLANARHPEAREVAEKLRSRRLEPPSTYTQHYEEHPENLPSASQFAQRAAVERDIRDLRLAEMEARFVEGDDERANDLAQERGALGDAEPVGDPVAVAVRRHASPSTQARILGVSEPGKERGVQPPNSPDATGAVPPPPQSPAGAGNSAPLPGTASHPSDDPFAPGSGQRDHAPESPDPAAAERVGRAPGGTRVDPTNVGTEAPASVVAAVDVPQPVPPPRRGIDRSAGRPTSARSTTPQQRRRTAAAVPPNSSCEDGEITDGSDPTAVAEIARTNAVAAAEQRRRDRLVAEAEAAASRKERADQGPQVEHPSGRAPQEPAERVVSGPAPVSPARATPSKGAAAYLAP